MSFLLSLVVTADFPRKSSLLHFLASRLVVGAPESLSVSVSLPLPANETIARRNKVV